MARKGLKRLEKDKALEERKLPLPMLAGILRLFSGLA